MAKSYTVQFGNGDPRGFTGLTPTFLSFYNLATGTTNTPPSIAETITGKTGVYTFTFGVTQPISFLIDAATTSPGTVSRYIVGQLDPADRADEYGNTMTALGQTIITQLTNTGSTLTAFGNTSVALGQTAVAQSLNIGATLVAVGNTQFAFGQSSIAIGTTLTGFANTLLAIGQSSPLFSFIGSTASSIGSTAIDPTTLFGFLMRAQEIAEGNQTYTKANGILDLFSRGATLLREKTISDTSTQTTKT